LKNSIYGSLSFPAECGITGHQIFCPRRNSRTSSPSPPYPPFKHRESQSLFDRPSYFPGLAVSHCHLRCSLVKRAGLFNFLQKLVRSIPERFPVLIEPKSHDRLHPRATSKTPCHTRQRYSQMRIAKYFQYCQEIYMAILVCICNNKSFFGLTFKSHKFNIIGRKNVPAETILRNMS